MGRKNKAKTNRKTKRAILLKIKDREELAGGSSSVIVTGWRLISCRSRQTVQYRSAAWTGQPSKC